MLVLNYKGTKYILEYLWYMRCNIRWNLPLETFRFRSRVLIVPERIRERLTAIAWHCNWARPVQEKPHTLHPHQHLSSQGHQDQSLLHTIVSANVISRSSVCFTGICFSILSKTYRQRQLKWSWAKILYYYFDSDFLSLQNLGSCDFANGLNWSSLAFLLIWAAVPVGPNTTHSTEAAQVSSTSWTGLTLK